jgi:hypothetical protein
VISFFGRILILSFLFMGCVSHPHRPDLVVETVGQSIPASNGWLKDVSRWHINSPGKPYSIQMDSSMKYQDEATLRFEMRSGDSWKGPGGSITYRNELIPSGFPPSGSTRFYACNVFIPKDFPIEENRLVLMQWWPLTKSELGEVGRSPSLALRYIDGTLSATIRHSDLHVVKDADSVAKKTLFKTSSLKRGEWNSFAFQATWSFKDNGAVKLWWNHKLVADYRGPVGYDDEQGPIFKFGMYRDDSAKTYVTFFNGCREGASLSEVQP